MGTASVAYTYALPALPLIFFTWLGVLLRWLCIFVWVDTLDVPSHTRVLFPNFAANVLGCALLGAFSVLKPHLPTRLQGPFSTGISTGFAGSTTTYSSWSVTVATTIASLEVLYGVLQLWLGWVLAYEAYTFGKHFAWAAESVLGHCLRLLGARSNGSAQESPEAVETKGTEGAPEAHDGKALEATIMCMLAALVVFGYVVMGCLFGLRASSRAPCAILMVAPAGTAVRYYLGVLHKHTAKITCIPVFTFTVNVLGSILLILLYILEDIVGVSIAFTYVDPLQLPDCWSTVWLSALGLGFCGCLTTVSTFVAEAHKLERLYAYAYVLGTVVTTQAILIPIAVIFL